MPDKPELIQYIKPPWLEEQSGIEALLHRVVNKLDAKPGSAPGFTLNKMLLPELFDLGEQSDLTWGLLQTLFSGDRQGSHAVFSFRENKKRNSLDPEYTGARIKFNSNAEALLRNWLNRPAQESDLQLWKRIVEENKSKFIGDISRLGSRNISVKAKTASEIVEGFIRIKDYLNEELTLRNLSARCFWQDSKFLDGREEIVKSLYPEIKIKTRPVLVSAFLPKNIQGVLFIENQDSYTQAMTGVPEGANSLALIYSSGFKLTAQRIRDPKGVSLHFCGNGSNDMQKQFIQWWYGENDIHMPIYFWGDLDYSGMDILGNLKQRFENITAWKEGYQPMLELILNGKGHLPGTTGKQDQKDPQRTGCDYADEILLPAIRKSGLFIDQEWVYK